jgi:hypothetical protein
VVLAEQALELGLGGAHTNVLSGRPAVLTLLHAVGLTRAGRRAAGLALWLWAKLREAC